MHQRITKQSEMDKRKKQERVCRVDWFGVINGPQIAIKCSTCPFAFVCALGEVFKRFQQREEEEEDGIAWHGKL